jgi:hypothetical protein
MFNINKLALIDSYHDFFEMDNENKYLEYFQKFIKFIDDNYKISKNVNNDKFKNKIKNEIIENNPKEGKTIKNLNDIIVDNFNIIFDFTNNKKCIKNDIIFNTLLSDNEKIMLRQQLYYLIKNKNDKQISNELINFILRYMNLDIYTGEITTDIKNNILKNLKNNSFNNITYPLTYFDDMTSGLNLKYFRFNILNLNKNLIDGSKTSSISTYFNNYENGKTNRKLLLNNIDDSIGFIVENKKDVIEIFDSKFYIDNNDIVSEYKNKIKFRLFSNTVGRNENNGIYQITHYIIQIIKNISNNIQQPNLDNNPNEILKTLKQKLTNNILELNKLNSLDDKSIMNSIKNIEGRKNNNKKSLNKYKDEIDTLIKDASYLNNNINNIKFNNNYFKYLEKIKIFIENTQHSKKILDDLKINLDFNDMMYLNYDYNKLKKISNKELALQIIFFEEIYKNKNNLSNIIDISDLHIQLKNLYIEFENDLDIVIGCLVNLLFGCKRFGDWIQVNLSKKFYFMLQTDDFYCKLYAYLIGAPVIIDNKFYNYNPPDDLKFNENLFRKIKLDDEKNENLFKIKSKSKNSIIYKSLKDINTNSLERYYYQKYLKYKNKYIKLKNNLSSF